MVNDIYGGSLIFFFFLREIYFINNQYNITNILTCHLLYNFRFGKSFPSLKFVNKTRDKSSIQRTSKWANKTWLKRAHLVLLKQALEALLSHLDNRWTSSAIQYLEPHNRGDGLTAILDHRPRGLISKNIKINTKALLHERSVDSPTEKYQKLAKRSSRCYNWFLSIQPFHHNSPLDLPHFFRLVHTIIVITLFSPFSSSTESQKVNDEWPTISIVQSILEPAESGWLPWVSKKVIF